MPTYIHPFISLVRLDRPIGFMLLFYPSSFALAGINIPLDIFFYYLFLFMIGSITMRSAGCIINDYFDIKFDKQVARTKDRALASNKVSKISALILFLILMTTGLILLVQFNLESILIGVLITPLIFLYPLAKRFFIFPQLILGLIYNWGVFIAWTAVGSIHSFKSILVLYLSSVLWTIVYDTIYATQDEIDDIKLKLYSSTLFIKSQRSLVLSLISVIQFFLLIIYGLLMQFNFLYFVLIGSILIIYATDIRFVWSNISTRSGNFFRRNNYYGFLILTTIIIGSHLNV